MTNSIDMTLVRGRGLRYLSDIDRLSTVPEFKREIKDILKKYFNNKYHQGCISNCFIVAIVFFFVFFTGAFFGARFVSKGFYGLIGACPVFIMIACFYMCSVETRRSKLIEKVCSQIDSVTNGCHRIDGKIFANRYVNNFKITTNTERLKKYKKEVAEGKIRVKPAPPPKPVEVKIPVQPKKEEQKPFTPPPPTYQAPHIATYEDGMKVKDLDKPTPGGLIPIVNPNVAHRQTAPNIHPNIPPPNYPMYGPQMPRNTAPMNNFGAFLPPGQNIYYSDPNRVNPIQGGGNDLPMYEINDPFDGPHTVRGSVNTNNPTANNPQIPMYSVPNQQLAPMNDEKKG